MLVQALSGSLSDAVDLYMVGSLRLTLEPLKMAHFPSFCRALNIECHRHVIHPPRTSKVPVVHMGV